MHGYKPTNHARYSHALLYTQITARTPICERHHTPPPSPNFFLRVTHSRAQPQMPMYLRLCKLLRFSPFSRSRQRSACNSLACSSFLPSILLNITGAHPLLQSPPTLLYHSSLSASASCHLRPAPETAPNTATGDSLCCQHAAGASHHGRQRSHHFHLPPLWRGALGMNGLDLAATLGGVLFEARRRI
jgi:hypothetical protein